MSLDELQQTWQSQGAAPTLRVAPEVLLAQVRRNQRSLQNTIFWRDFREVAVAFALIPIFAHAAWNQGWHWLSFCVACAFVGGYFIVDRWRQRGSRPAVDASVTAHVDQAIREVDHQIWLLTNIAWWYLGPLMLAAIFTFGYEAFTDDDSLTDGLLEVAGPLGTFVLVFAFVYWLNQYAVRKELEPRRQELVAVRESLLILEE
jgi:hypothetical protein